MNIIVTEIAANMIIVARIKSICNLKILKILENSIFYSVKIILLLHLPDSFIH